MALDIAFVGNAHGHGFIRNQVLDVDLGFLRHDLGTAFVLIGVLKFGQFVLDNLFDQIFRTQDGLQ